MCRVDVSFNGIFCIWCVGFGGGAGATDADAGWAGGGGEGYLNSMES